MTPALISDLCVVELHGVVGGQGDHQALLVELQQGVLGVLQEQAVVAEGGHGHGDLTQEVQVLQHGTLQGQRPAVRFRIGRCRGRVKG